MPQLDLFSTRFRRPGCCAGLLALIAAMSGASAAAQESDDKARPESVEIEPYTGPQIYLPEGEAPPEPNEVDSQVVVQNFPGTETVRFERRVVRYSDDSLKSDGPHKEFYSNGQLYVSGEFSRGRATGEWTYHHANGTVAKVVNYADGKPDGEVRVMTDEGVLVAIRNYEAGQREGTWESFTPDGKTKIREDNYKEGRADGVFRYWFPTGQLYREVNFTDGKQDGLTVEWTATGKKRAELNFKDGKRDGKATVWGRDGKTIVRTYADGKIVPNS